MPHKDQAGSAERSKGAILRSAREQVEKVGILGLRVADVAAGANCSITQIYRYFTDRDGLLAQVLGDMYDEFIVMGVSGYLKLIENINPLTIDILVDKLPLGFTPEMMRVQELRLQILAVATTNEALRLRLEQCTAFASEEWNRGLDIIESRLAPNEKLDRRVFIMVLGLQNPYYRALLGERAFTDSEYRTFLKEKMRAQ
jgi:AcrR family transcriptional regulator